MRKSVFWGLALMSIVGLFGCRSAVGSDGSLVGGFCDVSSQCELPARCLTGTAWPNGYCSQSCDSNEDCPGGAVCSEAEGGTCLVECTSDANCRTDATIGVYACAELPARGAGGTVMGCVGAE